jgi:AcrR family transcriptional regulator
MPRPEREQLILDLAGQVFARDGYHSASMDEIARCAGVSKPMLYAYFESKEGLYLSYIDRSGHELVERLQRAFAAGDPATVRVRERVSEFLSFVEEHRDGWRVLFGEASANRPVAEQVAEMRTRIAHAVRELVEAGLPEAASPPPATEAVAHAIVGAGESLANWWLEHPEVAREEVAAWYAAVVRASVLAVSPAAPGAAGA